MALAGIDRGSGARNTGGESTYAISPASTIQAGSMAVLSLACDNAAAGGGNSYSSVTDSVGNVWTNRVIQTKTAGVANDGVSVAIYDSTLTTAITSSNTITVTFSATTVARAYTLTQVSSNSGVVKLFFGDNSGSTGSSTTPSTTTHPVVSTGQLVLGLIGAEMGDGTITADSDSTNGSWSTAQTANVGVTTAGMEICTQYKVVTAGGAQTYNATITSANWSTGLMQYTDVVSTGIIPIGYASAEATTITIPVGHQAGDLLIIFAFRGATTAPSLPAGWTTLNSPSSGASSVRTGYKIAVSSADTSGTWTNATGLICHVYRGTATNKTPATQNQTTGTGTSVTYPAQNPLQEPGTSWMVAFAATKTTDSALETPPTNLTNTTTRVGAATEYASFDSNGIYTAEGGKWTAHVVAVGGTSAEWRAVTIEVYAEQGYPNNYQSVRAADPDGTGNLSVTEKIR